MYAMYSLLNVYLFSLLLMAPVSLNVPPPSKRPCGGKALPAAVTNQVSVNASLPTLQQQLATAAEASLLDKLVDASAEAPTAAPSVPPPADTGATLLGPSEATCAAPQLETNPYRPDSELGPLKERFDPQKCRFGTDQDMRERNSRVVVVDSESEEQLVMDAGAGEFYSMDHLARNVHSFENGPTAPSAHDSNLVTKTFPRARKEHCTPALSVLRMGSPRFKQHFGSIPIVLADLIRFVIEHGYRDKTRDGELPQSGPQNRRVDFGAGGYQTEDDEEHGVKAPPTTSGFQRAKDSFARQSCES